MSEIKVIRDTCLEDYLRIQLEAKEVEIEKLRELVKDAIDAMTYNDLKGEVAEEWLEKAKELIE